MTAGLALARPAPDYLASVCDLLRHAARTVGRIRSGEVTPVPRTSSAAADRVTRSSEGIRLLRVLIVGHVPEEIANAALRNVPTMDEAALALAVEGPFDVVVVANEAAAEEMRDLTSHPVVIDLPEARSTLRARLRLAVAADAARRIGGAS
jgi:hypothetical protein